MRHAHLLEIRKLHLTVKNLVHKGVDFYVQNAVKLTYDILASLIPKHFPGIIPPDPS